MSDDGLFPKIYTEFLKERDQAQGYDFQHSPVGSVPPPTVTFARQLRWWTWDRWRRIKKIRTERDRLQQDIIRLRKDNPPPPK